ncbi:MAG: class I SAM-dependent methyltransferase [Acidiferrobacterales bacterium]
MSSGPAMLAYLIVERLSRRTLPRVREPELSDTDSIAQNGAFELAGREDGILASIYLYHALQISPLVCPGDRVLDLGCGPANQLVQVARLNPQAHFIGLDVSVEMLERARQTIGRCGVANIETVPGDMTTLAEFPDGLFDCVMSTMSLHHLADEAALSDALCAAQRVLKPGGSVYLVDFGRLKRAATQRFFVEDRSDVQPEKFTRDYLNSLRAAFSVDELSGATKVLGDGVTRYTTALAPFTVIFKSAARRKPDKQLKDAARMLYRRLSASQQRDFRLYARWLRADGLALPFLPD